MIRPPVFDFASLDGLAFAAERGRFNGLALPRMAAQGLGPILELAQLADTGLLPAPEKAAWLALDGFEVLYRMLLTGRSQWVWQMVGGSGSCERALSRRKTRPAGSAFALLP